MNTCWMLAMSTPDYSSQGQPNMASPSWVLCHQIIVGKP